jgi:hypothetical protein
MKLLLLRKAQALLSGQFSQMLLVTARATHR